MGRVFFHRASSGFRTVRGEVLKKVQRKLKENNCDPGDIDGVFGDRTELGFLIFCFGARRQRVTFGASSVSDGFVLAPSPHTAEAIIASSRGVGCRRKETRQA